MKKILILIISILLLHSIKEQKFQTESNIKLKENTFPNSKIDQSKEVIIPDKIIADINLELKRINKRGSSILVKNDSIDYKDIYEVSSYNIKLPNIENLYKSELEKYKPNFIKLVTYLLFGADINYKNSNGKKISELKGSNNGTALVAASYSGYLTVVEELIKEGMDPNSNEEFTLSPLEAASYGGHSEIISFLIKKGAEVDRPNKYSWTPLMIATYNNHKSVIAELIKNGAGINKSDKDGWTPLMIAANRDYPEIVQLLIDNGANIKTFTNDGFSPIILASKEGYVDTLKILLNSIDTETDKLKAKKEALEIAIKAKNENIEDFLDENIEIFNGKGNPKIFYTESLEFKVSSIKIKKRVESMSNVKQFPKIEGIKYLVINTSLKNLKGESKNIGDGNLILKSENENLKLEKSEIILEETGWKIFTEIKPSETLKTKIVYTLNDKSHGKLYFIPNSGKEEVFLGEI